ncbi:MAG: hypothetical protein IKT32_05885, partial [Clostridia bacterium]|nr:hypothetical protein [Clostridia bacterium]
ANKTDYNPDGTILGRYTEEQEAFYNIDNKYYGIPHYASYSGFHYDVDLWEREYPLCLYLDDNGKFVTDAKNVSLRSKGPDNIKGTHDDGLPATYDEFFKVFDRMVATQVTPIIWSGFSQGYYWNTLCNLQANADGFDNYYLNYSLSGKANNIVESVTLGSNFESTVLKVHEKDITDENAYLLFGSSGRYYASKFMEKIITNYNKYVYFDSFSPTHSHLDAQYDFIASKYDTTQKPIGMIIEGTWWENEVSARFEDMAVVYGEEASRKGRNFAFLPYPLPKKLADGETHQNILLNNGATHSFINSSIDESKVELAKDFLRFFYTEKELINFTLETNTSIGLKYELSDEQLKELSPYGRSLLLTVMNSKVLYQYSQNPVFLNNITNLQQSSTWQAEIETSLGLVTKTDMMNAYRYDDTSAEDYFWGMVEKYDKEWWQNNII